MRLREERVRLWEEHIRLWEERMRLWEEQMRLREEHTRLREKRIRSDATVGYNGKTSRNRGQHKISRTLINTKQKQHDYVLIIL